MFDVVVLAGGHNNGPLQEYCMAGDEATIKIGEKFMVEYVVESIRQCKSTGKIALVGPVSTLRKIFRHQNCVFASPGNDAIESLQKGIKELKETTKRILVVTADIPLITPQALENFLAKSNYDEIDVCYPLVPKEVIQEKFPEMKRTYMTLKEGVLTGGNIFLINPQIIDCCADKAKELMKLRKSPIKVFSLLGPGFLIRFLLHRLSINEVAQKVSDLMSINSRGVISHYPEVGVDVDKPSDLKLVEKFLAAN